MCGAVAESSIRSIGDDLYPVERVERLYGIQLGILSILSSRDNPGCTKLRAMLRLRLHSLRELHRADKLRAES